MNNLTLDLSLQPTTLDAWHAVLAASVGVFVLLFFIALIGWIAARNRARSLSAQPAKVIEKIVEVEKLVRIDQPAPEPIILKQASADAALQLLGILQKEARFLDFIQEDMAAYADADIGAAARIVHQGCRQAVQEHFTIVPVSTAFEGDRIQLDTGFNAAEFRLTGNITGQAPFSGTLIHKGWRVIAVKLPQLTEGHDCQIIAPAEVEL